MKLVNSTNTTRNMKDLGTLDSSFTSTTAVAGGASGPSEKSGFGLDSGLGFSVDMKLRVTP